MLTGVLTTVATFSRSLGVLGVSVSHVAAQLGKAEGRLETLHRDVNGVADMARQQAERVREEFRAELRAEQDRLRDDLRAELRAATDERSTEP